MLARVVIKTIGRDTLKNAVLSAHREGFETIVVSDGPRKNNWEDLMKEKIYPKELFILPKKCGEYGAVAANVGVAFNDAEYTIFLDDDDEFKEGAGEYMRSKLMDQITDLWVPGLDFGTFTLCNDPLKGFVPGNIGMVTYRTKLLQKFPMQYLGPKGAINYYDYYHAKECVARGASWKHYGKLLYDVRPKLPGTNGRGE
jgi:hypothetical protein